MFERFTERSRRAMVLAQEEARLLNHHFIGTEHLLLGLLHEGEGVAAQALGRLGVSLELVREKVEDGAAPSGPTAGVQSPPFTPRAKKVLELALREALQYGHNYIGTEHLLLGILREGEGRGAHVLVELGHEPATVRRQVIDLLTDPSTIQDRSVPSDPAPLCPTCRSPVADAARVRHLDIEEDSGAGAHGFLVVYCGVCGQSLAFKPADPT